MTNKGITTKSMVLIALFAALTAVFSQINIPLPFTPIPINLATLSIFIAGGLLGSVRGSISLLVYVLLGASGAPVFAGLSGGFDIIAGQRGGYIIGYIVMAFVIGALSNLLIKIKFGYEIAMLAGILCCYILGTAWFMFITNAELLAAITMCVLPFILGDIFKIIAAAFFIRRMKKIIGL